MNRRYRNALFVPVGALLLAVLISRNASNTALASSAEENPGVVLVHGKTQHLRRSMLPQAQQPIWPVLPTPSPTEGPTPGPTLGPTTGPTEGKIRALRFTLCACDVEAFPQLIFGFSIHTRTYGLQMRTVHDNRHYWF